MSLAVTLLAFGGCVKVHVDEVVKCNELLTANSIMDVDIEMINRATQGNL
jgi:hypothetical protein